MLKKIKKLLFELKTLYLYLLALNKELDNHFSSITHVEILCGIFYIIYTILFSLSLSFEGFNFLSPFITQEYFLDVKAIFLSSLFVRVVFASEEYNDFIKLDLSYEYSYEDLAWIKRLAKIRVIQEVIALLLGVVFVVVINYLITEIENLTQLERARK